MNQFNNLNSLGLNEELETRINQLSGILATLESAMADKNGFITIQPLAIHSVGAALRMTEECSELNQRAFKLLPREVDNG